MLRYAVTFLIVALIASALGMFSLKGVAMVAARILFFVFIVLLVVSLISGRRERWFSRVLDEHQRGCR